MAGEGITIALQQSLVTLLVYRDEGRQVAQLLNPALCDGDYKLIAERAIKHWQDYDAPPATHMDELLADILEDADDRRAPTFRRLLGNMHQLHEEVQAKYVLGRLRVFVRLQTIKGAIIEAAETLQSKQESGLSEVEAALDKVLRSRDAGFSPGMRLTDYSRVVTMIQTRYGEFDTGIPDLDRRYIVPGRGEAFMVLAPSGVGKTWALVHIGKRALLRRKKVLHITTEINEEKACMRYYQSMLAVPKRRRDDLTTPIVQVENGKIIGFDSEPYTPAFSMDSPLLELELETRLGGTEYRADHLIIKQFPPHQLTIPQLRAYLDSLEAEGFIPDMLIFDYLGLFWIDEKNPRISLGRTFVGFRGMCMERGIAGVIAHQTNRASADAIQVGSQHVSEDWSIIGTCDIIVTLTRTVTEKLLGLMRVTVDKARDEEDKWVALITQAYAIGQFCLSSHYVGSAYYKLLKTITDEMRQGDVVTDDGTGDGADAE